MIIIQLGQFLLHNMKSYYEKMPAYWKHKRDVLPPILALRFLGELGADLNLLYQEKIISSWIRLRGKLTATPSRYAQICFLPKYFPPIPLFQKIKIFRIKSKYKRIPTHFSILVFCSLKMPILTNKREKSYATCPKSEYEASFIEEKNLPKLLWRILEVIISILF